MKMHLNKPHDSSLYNVRCPFCYRGNYDGVDPYKKGTPCTECALGSYQCHDGVLCRKKSSIYKKIPNYYMQSDPRIPKVILSYPNKII